MIFDEVSDEANLVRGFGQIGADPYSPMNGGAAAGDFNNDGWQDLFVLGGGGGADMLYMNMGETGTVGRFSERAADWGVDRLHYGTGASVADFNNDGYLDIYVTSDGAPGMGPQPGRHLLYMNTGGGSFIEVAAQAGLDYLSLNIADGFSSAWGDYDNDGDLDLAAVSYFLNAGGNHVFRNNGDGTFEKVTESVLFNLDGTPWNNNSLLGFSVQFADMDGDRYPELLFVGDFSSSKYFRNNRDGTFTDITPINGTGVDRFGMGTDVGDVNNDGLLDWYVTSIDAYDTAPDNGNMFYLNMGNHQFQEMSRDPGVNLNAAGWGWGTVIEDFNHDMLPDIAETNGWGAPYDQVPCFLFINQGNLQFIDEAEACGFDEIMQGRGMLNFDYDNDGDQDVAVFSNVHGITLLRNDLSGTDCGYLRVFLDTQKNDGIAPNGIGSVVRVTAGGITQTRAIDASSNFLSQSEMTAHFGLSNLSVIDQIRIEWSNGTASVLNDVPINQTMTITANYPGDANGDDLVNFDDLVSVIMDLGAGNTPNDLDGNGAVEFNDAIFALFNWR
ncbi:CRTAC1 family protein [Planctomycetaceae bacterium AH-315-I19]|nr:CRTAC1 family protein [Planctomycetaceae bacterium AH-315-I19]